MTPEERDKIRRDVQYAIDADEMQVTRKNMPHLFDRVYATLVVNKGGLVSRVVV